MKEGQDNYELLERLLLYLEGKLSLDDTAEIEGQLKSDAGARALLRDIAEQAVVVADEVRGKHCRDAAPNVATHSLEQRLRIWPSLLAASVTLLLALGWWFLSHRADQVVSIVELNGPVRWTGDGGKVMSLQRANSPLEGGTVRTLTNAASVSLQFSDGSEITLAGDSEATFSEARQQKQVHLNQGDLSASIEEQRPGRPFLIYTATAKMEVLGTRFEVQSAPDTTLLTVTEGAVRVTRKIDGSIVEVPADYEVNASLERGCE